jgi:asparagine synthase (glutamine-hydrolysing)
MCGIAGIIARSGRLSPDELKDLASRMADRQFHRGPDDGGVWVSPDGRAALSQRRLSILDLSAAGHQPMTSPRGNGLTFNGEIYNHAHLRPRLTEQGYRFHSTTDTETLLYGLEEDGPAVTEQLDGMYAFGFYDSTAHRLTLARDIFGEKPLYYAESADWFAFASELSALTVLPGFDASIDRHRVALYFLLQYVPAPLTIYRGASKLPPGHVLQLDATGPARITRHFAFRPTPAPTQRPLDDLADELEDLLTTTVDSRLLSDVPLGAFLSGGVDSSTVAAIITQKLKRPLMTFSIGFQGAADSEHEEARAVAHHLRTTHHDQILDLDALTLGQQIAGVLDEPNGDTSCLPTWALSRLARGKVTVALSGDGGDELFGGYGRYFRTLEDLAANPTLDPAATYYSNRILIFPEPTLEKVMGPLPAETHAFMADLRAPLRRQDVPLLHKLRETDIENYMPGAVLAKVDRMSMQHALETRAPLLGRAIADFAMNCTVKDLYHPPTDGPGQGKRVLKRVASRFLPPDWMARPKKGFGMPVAGWGGAALAAEVQKLLLSPDCRLAAWIDIDHRRRFCAFHAATPVTYHLWTVFLLESWLRSHPHSAIG